MKVTRLFADEEGETHFEDAEVDLESVDYAPPAPPLNLSAFEPAIQYGICVASPGARGIEDFGDYPHRLTLKEGVEATKIIAEAGADIIDVSGGIGGGRPERLEGPGFFVPQAEAVKEVVNVPVIGVGGIKTAEEADAIIASGRVDLVAIGRAYLSEPDWATIATKKLS